MKHKTLVFSLIATCFFIQADHFPAVTTSTTTSQTEDFTKLTLEILSTKEEFLEAEPIPIRITLSNKTERPIKGHSIMDFSSGYVKVFVKKENTEKQRIEVLSLLTKLTVMKPISIQPGSQRGTTQVLNLKLNEIFPQAGTYLIQITLHNIEGTVEIESNYLTINIAPPEGLNLRALNDLKEHHDISYFFAGKSDNQSDTGILASFIAEFGESVYADYVRFILGEKYFITKRYEKAREQFTKLTENSSFALAEKSSDYLKQIEQRLLGASK